MNIRRRHPLGPVAATPSRPPATAYADGRFFIASSSVSAGNDAEEKETKTMMAFGK
ncbi:hypothetical protein OG883_28175 [Streptomyces sp. NBC_01142]|uniref:hypothetical protein n=1 Tax=Streptomyces sp. NBC_01142 TaxID=2975865 RepID=UPI002250CFAD|nr:hypothetical protein [Streptomyces sp. NBC_01142]MCX4823683.1 hypothetical protein [Streptomyces sp. NBC_01142]